MVKGNKNHGSQRDCEVKGIVVSRQHTLFISPSSLVNYWPPYMVYFSIWNLYSGAGDPGGPGGPGPPLELGIYRVKILKIRKTSFFLLIGPPLGKNRSPAPAYHRAIFTLYFYVDYYQNNQFY